MEIQLTPKRGILFALLLLMLRLRFDVDFRKRSLVHLITYDSFRWFALYLVRFLLGYAIPPILVNFHYRHPAHAAQDGKPYFDHLKYVRRTRYGPHSREEMDELLPVDGQTFSHPNRIKTFHQFAGPLHLVLDVGREVLEFIFLHRFDHHPHSLPVTLGKVRDSAPAVLFGHGGGWCCQGTDVQLGQLPAICRLGEMAIFTFNYPLCPENRFPDAVVSTLRAMSYLRANRGYDSLALLGESAGGNLITMAALFVCNPRLLTRLAEETGVPVDRWPYPRITCVCSWYGILDSHAWKHANWLWSGLETVWEWYKSDKMGGKLTLCDYEDELEVYPPTLLVVGSYDPLGLLASSQAAEAMLKRKRLEVKLAVYDATHGFVGYPPAFQTALNGGDSSHWLENCQKASFETVAFLKKHHANERRTVVLDG